MPHGERGVGDALCGGPQVDRGADPNEQLRRRRQQAGGGRRQRASQARPERAGGGEPTQTVQGLRELQNVSSRHLREKERPVRPQSAQVAQRGPPRPRLVRRQDLQPISLMGPVSDLLVT